MPARELEVRPQEKWLCALGNTTDGVFIIDSRQRIIFWNKGAERILGYSRASVRNQFCYKVLAGRCCDKLFCYADCKVCKRVRRGLLPEAPNSGTGSEIEQMGVL